MLTKKKNLKIQEKRIPKFLFFKKGICDINMTEFYKELCEAMQQSLVLKLLVAAICLIGIATFAGCGACYKNYAESYCIITFIFGGVALVFVIVLSYYASIEYTCCSRTKSTPTPTPKPKPKEETFTIANPMV